MIIVSGIKAQTISMITRYLLFANDRGDFDLYFFVLTLFDDFLEVFLVGI